MNADRDLIASLDHNHPETMALVRSEAASKAVAEVLDPETLARAIFEYENPSHLGGSWEGHEGRIQRRRIKDAEGIARNYRALIASERGT